MNIFLDNVPAGTTVGVDLNHFQLPASKPFHGFKYLPKYNGNTIHILHFQSDETGIRYGYWINSEHHRYAVFQYDPVRELMVPQPDVSNEEATYRFEQCQHLMIEYPENEDSEQWKQLVEFIRWKEVRVWCESEYNHESYVYVDSSMTSTEEANILQKRIGDTQQSMILAPTTECTLGYTPIRFKHPDSMRPEFKMHDFLDKSWYLTHVILTRYHYSNMTSLFGELQFSYLNSIIFANYGSSLQWHNIIELICFSDCLAEQKYGQVMGKLDSLLCVQMNRLPEEYEDFLINTQLMQSCVKNSTVPLPAWKKLAKEKFLGETESEAEAADPDVEYEAASSDEDEYAPTVASQLIYGARNKDPVVP
ncbi:unnamed protein product [Kluyveromyces dobzhanskii CBS 2104]|uniref:WGS project CCBQ000000000 data, contig 00011 n=1 Tax=Kluyveromyces dobzhanskii CBS 2104 TaxID=1427455 RepID=A0A0A8L7Y4_9SACH|nr:unnamed protein product [Kluyveromyces dobzhanskii CBS 2104]